MSGNSVLTHNSLIQYSPFPGLPHVVSQRMSLKTGGQLFNATGMAKADE